MSLFARKKTQGQPSSKFNWVEPVDSRAEGHLFQYLCIGSLSPPKCDKWETERWRQREHEKTRNTGRGKLSKERKKRSQHTFEEVANIFFLCWSKPYILVHIFSFFLHHTMSKHRTHAANLKSIFKYSSYFSVIGIQAGYISLHTLM